MSEISSKLEALGLVLPAPIKPPPGIVLPFSWVRLRGNRAYVSGHIALKPDGSIAEPLGKVGAEVSEKQGYDAARLTALAILGSLTRKLGDLDRITAWLRVFGMVNAAPGFDRQGFRGFRPIRCEFQCDGCDGLVRTFQGSKGQAFCGFQAVSATVRCELRTRIFGLSLVGYRAGPPVSVFVKEGPR